MRFFLRILIGLTLTFFSHFIVASDTNITQLEERIEAKEAELRSLKQQLKDAKKKLEDPCTCVFNKNRMWNPEKVLWNDVYWICSTYKDNGECSEVKKINDVSMK